MPISGTSPAMKPWIDGDATGYPDRPLLDPHDLVDEGAHRLARGREDVDHPAIEHRHDRLDAALERIDRDAPEILGAVDEVRMRELLEVDEEIRRRDALRRQMAVRIEFGADEDIRPDDLADAREEIALGILVAVGNHRAVQTRARRHRPACAAPQLVEDFVAQALIGRAVDEPCRIGPGGGALDQLPALFARRPAGRR